jgi:hypothetical protein
VTERQGWEYLAERAVASNRDSRKIAVLRAYSWGEHALKASGLRKQRGIRTANLLLQAYFARMLNAELTEHAIRSAILIRHEAAHEDTIPGIDACGHAVAALSIAWHDLRSQYVTLKRAESIAAQITSIDGVRHVLLYGSLARSHPQPGDIDLLIMDDGRYIKPWWIQRYS